MSLVDWEVWKSKVVCRYNDILGLFWTLGLRLLEFLKSLSHTS